MKFYELFKGDLFYFKGTPDIIYKSLGVDGMYGKYLIDSSIGYCSPLEEVVKIEKEIK
jgi:predicted proteasome-type protease